MKKTLTQIRIVFIAALLVCAGAVWTADTATAQPGDAVTIAAVVNESAVSGSDLRDRMKLVIVSSGLPNSDEIRARMKPQIMNALIDESLIFQEAARLDIEVPPEAVESGFAKVAAQNNMSADEFRRALRGENIPVSTIYDQIRAQVAWSQIIQKELRPKIQISDDEVDAALARIRDDIGTTRYLVSEIFLPVANPSDEGDVRQLADKLVAQISQGGVPFQRVASQFSQSAGATRGGDLGWVQEGQLPEALDGILERMNEGELSKPVRSLSGYHILYLRKKNTLTEEDIPSRDALYNQLGMEELDRRQRRYLLDLKSAAFIEQRV